MRSIVINRFLLFITFFVFGVILVATASEAKINTDSMVAAWFFDEGKGKNVEDSSAHSNHGKIKGNPKWVAGKFGRALELDGGTYVEVADNSSLDIVDYYSGDGNYFLSTGCGGGPTQAKFGITSTNGHTCGPASPVLKKDTWYHVAGVFDGKKLSVFIDGELETVQDQGGNITTSDWPIIIGSYAGLGYKSNAIIDELAVFNVA
ncbi:hypothetical protein CMK22_17790, partial [Candidatus Poribacteria bacterium]|nr:hypothetical protein [Candidatus Poribacteria bacterium]